MSALNTTCILNIYKPPDISVKQLYFFSNPLTCFSLFSREIERFLLSLPFLDRDATRYLYISKANTKSICVIMQFNCICSANLSSSIYKLLYYKKFKGLAESQIRSGSNIKTLSTREISKSTSRQQNIKWCVEKHKRDINSLNADCCCFIWDLSKSILLKGFVKFTQRDPICHFLLTSTIWVLYTYICVYQ